MEEHAQKHGKPRSAPHFSSCCTTSSHGTLYSSVKFNVTKSRKEGHLYTYGLAEIV
jgi:hypothetical protein